MTTDYQLSLRRTVLILLTFIGIAGGVIWLSIQRDQQAMPRDVPSPTAVRSELMQLQAVGQSLRALQPGMTRAEVDGMLGPAESNTISPVEHVMGQPVYSVRYAAYLSEPLPFAPTVSGYCEAELVFDAGRAGHPLIRVGITSKPLPPGLAVPQAAT